MNETILIRMLKTTDIAWLAGLLDGEGCFICFRINRNRKGSSSIAYHVNLAMTDRETIDQASEILRAISGDSVAVRNKNPLSGFSKRQQYVVDVSTKVGVIKTLEALRPYLVTKSLQADLVLSVLRRAAQVKRYTATALDLAMISVLHRLKKGCREARAEAEEMVRASQVILSQADLELATAGNRSEGAETSGMTSKNISRHEPPGAYRKH